MSEHIPFEIQEEIIKWLPVKSLIQFRSVSKTWKSLIDSSPFIAAHGVRRPHSHRLLVRYIELNEIDETYLSIVDDNTFPQNKVALPVPSSVQLVQDLRIFGSSHGLFCMSGYYEDDEQPDDSFQVMAVLWNPSIRKTVAISLSNDPNSYGRVFGFGVCPVTTDTKILMTCSKNCEQVKVFTLSSGTWRRSTISLPRKFSDLTGSQAVVDRFIYWLVYDSIPIDGGVQRYNLMLSYNLTNDEFEIVYLPFDLTFEPATDLAIFERKESLAIVQYNFDINLKGYTVWKMKHCVSDSVVFMKLYTLTVHDASINALLGFRKSGEHILEVHDDEDKALDMVAFADYKKYSEHYSYYDIFGSQSTFCAHSYKETLLLLDQPDSISDLAMDENEDDD